MYARSNLAPKSQTDTSPAQDLTAHADRLFERSILPRAVRVDEGANAVGSEAEHAIAHPVDKGTVVEEQEHRHQETHKRREQPQETEALLYPIPGSEDHCEKRQDREQDQEHEALYDLHRV